MKLHGSARTSSQHLVKLVCFVPICLYNAFNLVFWCIEFSSGLAHPSQQVSPLCPIAPWQLGILHFLQDFSEQLKSSSEEFEKFRSSLRGCGEVVGFAVALFFKA